MNRNFFPMLLLPLAGVDFLTGLYYYSVELILTVKRFVLRKGSVI